MFDNFEVDPSNQLWEHIEKQLPPEKQKRKGLKWFFASAFLLIALTAVSFYVILKDDDAAPQITKNQNTNVNSKAIKTVSDSLNNNIQSQQQVVTNNTSAANNKTGNTELANGTKAPKQTAQKNKIFKNKHESKISEAHTNEISNIQIDSTAIAKNADEWSEKSNTVNSNTNNEIPVVDNSIASNKFSRYMIDSLLGNLNNISFFDSIKTKTKPEPKSRFRIGVLYSRLVTEFEFYNEEFTYEAIKYSDRYNGAPGEGASGYFAMTDYVSKNYFRARIGFGLRVYNRQDFMPSLWKSSSGELFAHTHVGNLNFDGTALSINVLPITTTPNDVIIMPIRNEAGDSARLLTKERINMLDIPLMFGWQFVKNRKLTPYILLGSHVFVPFKHTESIINTLNKKEVKAYYTNDTKFKTALAPCAVAGFEFRLTPQFYIQANAGYTLVVTPLTISESAAQGARRTMRFEHYEFQAGFQYRLK
jgi:hypothetical protein